MRKISLFSIITLLLTGCSVTKQPNYNYIPATVEDSHTLICNTDKNYDGHVYEFSGYHFESGDEVTVIFDDNGTPDVKDDRIYSIVMEVK